MKCLQINHIKWLHNLLIEETGGLAGILDENLLELTVKAPFQTFDGAPLYQTLEMKAARLGYSIIKNHPFVDGNKRLGMMAMLTFLDLKRFLSTT